MEEKMLKELQKVSSMLETMCNANKYPYELLTVEQVHEEFDIGVVMVRKMFKDPELPVQRYTRPFKVTRRAIEEYMNVHHDYLVEN